MMAALLPCISGGSEGHDLFPAKPAAAIAASPGQSDDRTAHLAITPPPVPGLLGPDGAADQVMSRPEVSYHLDDRHRFVIGNYNWAKPFSSYLPGIAGLWGVPMWVFHVNRGQAVVSAGVRDKDSQILEFLSFNRACQLVETQGFRTFIRCDDAPLYEPFRKQRDPEIEQTMFLSPGEIELRDRNGALGLETEILYYTLPGSRVPGLVRQVVIRNLSRKSRRIEVVDGLPRLLPYGMNQQHIKFTSRHIEAMMGVETMEGVNLYRLKQTPADSERIGRLEGGNFHALFDHKGELQIGSVAYDPDVVFGEPFELGTPWVFAESGLNGIRSRKPIAENRTPCALAMQDFRLPPGGDVKLLSITGTVEKGEHLKQLLEKVRGEGYFESKRDQNRAMIDSISSLAFTASALPEFDAYAAQNFLDNVIRGGMPLTFETAKGSSSFYVYSRQNGDLERDYHHFVLEPTYLSQGTGHYRSVLQNRRSDIWFFPDVGDANLLTFMNLIQTDGYNPLEVRGITYSIVDLAGATLWLEGLVPDDSHRSGLLKMIQRGFTPGEFLMGLEETPSASKWSLRKILAELLSFCEQNDAGGLHEGFWIDHWHYNLDLIDAYLAIYPDRLEDLLFKRKDYTFYDDPDVVLPRREKFQLVQGHVRQYGAVHRDPEKLSLIEGRSRHAARVRTRGGKGTVYRTHLFVKLLCIVVNRLATLDPFGIGVEMEADKPGWNDSMNGLPGLAGSSLGETLELLKACRFLSESLSHLEGAQEQSVTVFEELAVFIRGMRKTLDRRLRSRARNKAFVFWDESHTLKESYRQKTRLGVSGKEKSLEVPELTTFLKDSIKLLEKVFEGPNRRRSISPQGVPYTYFINEATGWTPLETGRAGKTRPRLSRLGNPLVEPTEFRQRPVALFLEGPVHFMKVRPQEAPEVYDAVQRSALFDKKLKMYRSCESLAREPFEIGRVSAYPRGWIENESIYLHMEYKYLLEILKSGLASDFFADAASALVCFMDPGVYGRSILEGASFITSSINLDPGIHGQAFQPRQSGITCEMIHIWTFIVAGSNPFFLGDEGSLALRLHPTLPGKYFTRSARMAGGLELPRGSFAFRFLGNVLVVYHNPKRHDTFGEKGVRPAAYVLTYTSGQVVEVEADHLGTSTALDVRQGHVARVDVTLR